MSSIQAGTVLLDNTTVFGAKHAYAAWPVDPAEWTTGALAVDLRSLMDLIEALILHDSVLIDSVTRDYTAWPELMAIANTKGRAIVLDEEILYFDSDNREIGALIVRGALARTLKHLRSGDFATQAQYLEFARGGATLPALYKTPGDFAEFLSDEFGTELREALWDRLDEFREKLDLWPATVTNYALFAFRAFYYQALAHFHSISYVPHAWRSPLIAAELEAPDLSFAAYVAGVATEVREELVKRLDGEFGSPALKSEFPFFASYVAAQATSRADLLPIALEIRHTRGASAFRSWIRDVQTSIVNKADLPKIAQAQREIAGVLADLRRDLGLAKSDSQVVTLKLAVPLGSAMASAETPVEANAPRWVRKLFHRRTHLVFLRDVARESTRVAPFLTAFQRLAG
jgi:hypothetical protein